MRTHLIRIAATAAAAVFAGAGIATTAHADEPFPLQPLPEVAEPEPDEPQLCLTLDGKNWVPCTTDPEPEPEEQPPLCLTLDAKNWVPCPDPEVEEPPVEEPPVEEPPVEEPQGSGGKNQPKDSGSNPAAPQQPAGGTDSSEAEDSADDPTPDPDGWDELDFESFDSIEQASEQGSGTNLVWALVAGVLGLIGLTLLVLGLRKRSQDKRPA